MGIFGKLLSAYVKKERRPFCSAVIVAAGQSRRMGGEDKIFSDLCGLPVIVRTLMTFQSSEYIDEIIVVTRENSVSRIAELCETANISKVSKIVCGGDERIDSVLAGTAAASPSAELLAIHDGARPLVTPDIIEDTLKDATRFGAAAPAVKVHDTLKRAKNGIITETVDRSEIFAVQTPQVFRAPIIKAALQNAKKKALEVTDDCMAAEAMGVSIKLSQGSIENFKITTPKDLLAAAAVVEKRGLA